MGKVKMGYLCPHPPVILNEVGKGREVEIQNTIDAMNEVAREIKKINPKNIIIITPHGPVFRDAIAVTRKYEIEGDFEQFGAKDVHFKKKMNIEFVDNLIEKCNKKNISTVTIDDISAALYNISSNLDHGAMVPMYFIDKQFDNYNLIHITYGYLSKEELYKFGVCMQEVAEELDEDVLVIASGDLSHKLKNMGTYRYDPMGEVFDKKLTKAIDENRYKDIFTFNHSMCESADECGLRSIYIMLGVLDKLKVKSKVLSYEGPFGVGYGVAKFEVIEGKDKSVLDYIKDLEKNKMKIIRDSEDEYVELARKTLETYIKSNEIIEVPANLPIEMKEKTAGVFVSIKEEGQLRGCIGTILPTKENIAKEIIDNAIKAGSKDPRFTKIKEYELEKLVYSVDVLTEPEIINSMEMLDPKKYGVIVTSKTGRGVLLPDLKGIDTVDVQVKIAMDKGRIKQDEEVVIQRFEVIRHF